MSSPQAAATPVAPWTAAALRSMAGMEAPAPAPIRARVSVGPPECVFQTRMEDGKQDSSTPLLLEIALEDDALFEALRGTVMCAGDARSTRKVKAAVGGAPVELGDVSRHVCGTLRRFDGAEVEVYDEHEGCMQGLRLLPACFAFSLASNKAIRIQVHRKYLPVSKCHGYAPFLFAFVVEPPGVDPVVVATTSFLCCSKEPAAPPAPRQPPKRVRNRPSAKPVTAPPSKSDNLVKSFFVSALAGDSVLSDAEGASAFEQDGPHTPPQPGVDAPSTAGTKRARGGGTSPVDVEPSIAVRGSLRKRACQAEDVVPPPTTNAQLLPASVLPLEPELDLSPNLLALFSSGVGTLSDMATLELPVPAPAARAFSTRSLGDFGALVGSFPPLRGTSMGMLADALDALGSAFGAEARPFAFADFPAPSPPAYPLASPTPAVH